MIIKYKFKYGATIEIKHLDTEKDLHYTDCMLKNVTKQELLKDIMLYTFISEMVNKDI